MKSKPTAMGLICALGIGLAALTLAPAAHARSDVYWSVGIGAPGVSVGVTNGYPVYAAPAPVYVQPRPVYVQPRPVYVQPRPVYVAPPVYYGAPVYGPPVVVAPPVYPIGWGPAGHWRGHRHHHHHRGHGRHGRRR